MDEMNIGEEEEKEGEEKQKRKGGTTSHTVGRIARQTLNFPARRMAKGYVIIYVREKMEALRLKYGIQIPVNGEQGAVSGEQKDPFEEERRKWHEAGKQEEMPLE
jgi:hypothetical protein